MIRVGTAGWTLPRAEQEHFPAEGTHLQRYAGRFSAAEINSSFYRPHRPSTYARWAESVPAGFLFSIKLPKAITHTQRLRDADALLDGFLGEAAGLGDRLGGLLVQLPPSLEFDSAVAEAFFSALRGRSSLAIACEPRHPTWFGDEAAELLARFRVARVAADPARVPSAAEPGGWPDLVYFRLHGSPRIYYSAYEPAYLDALAARLRAEAAAGRQVWCIFDNTASGAAAADALGLAARLDQSHCQASVHRSRSPGAVPRPK
ncbi:MAG: FIG003003: hypothetical protein [uncultured Gemmatimonadetes bacterium]|uniref:DUF72 domain-containing protein n=1 Tax=uncultured Gemmatimonadota bacterium TaxID=203437 RepID=A0A6J4N4Z0_9BACT|nr:MAG: FIG003003: hypothetical protein [uncultured Gemmatimonadota bacterium]